MNKLKKIIPLILAVVLVFGSCLTVSAEEEKTVNIQNVCSALSSQGFSYVYQDYIVLIDSGYYYTLLISSSPIVYKSNRLYTNVDNGLYRWFIIDENYNKITSTGNSGVSGNVTFSVRYYSDSSNYSELIGESLINKLIESSCEIYDENNEMVFPEPAVPIAQKAEVLPEIVNNQIAVILTIAVACLALLVTLSVLRKKLPNFL